MRPRIKREPHLPGETVVEYEVRIKAKSGTFASLGDTLLKRYVTDFIKIQQESSPIASLFKKRLTGSENEKLTIKGKGTFYAKM